MPHQVMMNLTLIVVIEMALVMAAIFVSRMIGLPKKTVSMIIIGIMSLGSISLLAVTLPALLSHYR